VVANDDDNDDDDADDSDIGIADDDKMFTYLQVGTMYSFLDY
jgi:hypothetical protein